MTEMDSGKQVEMTEDWVHWASDEINNEGSIALLAEEKGASIKQVFATFAFLHARGSKQPDILSHAS